MEFRLRIFAFASLTIAASGCEGAREPPPHLRIEGGQSSRGAQLIRDRGCGTCHLINGIPGAVGAVGPALTNFSQRSILAGRYANVPRNLVPWLMDPPAMRPGTAMPNLGITADEARHIATYLYTQGAERAEVYQMRPTEGQYPWLPEAEANRNADARRLTETQRLDAQRARIPINRAMELLPTMPDVDR